jgi:hypothetical protein
MAQHPVIGKNPKHTVCGQRISGALRITALHKTGPILRKIMVLALLNPRMSLSANGSFSGGTL